MSKKLKLSKVKHLAGSASKKAKGLAKREFGRPALSEKNFGKAGLKDALRVFWYGRPHEERRLGNLYLDKTGLYRHREWRGFIDTMYYFNMIWLYNYACIGKAVLSCDDLLATVKGLFRYRWIGEAYIPALAWFDRGLEGLRGPALRASAWHYNAMLLDTIRQFTKLCAADKKLHNGRGTKAYYRTIAHDETVGGSFFWPFAGQIDNIALQMIPYFVSVHVNSNVVLNYIDAMQGIGLPADPCPMCQAESGLFVLDDVPDYSPIMITSNEACDGSVATSITTDWFFDKPLFALPQPMRFDDPLVQENHQREIEAAWDFIEKQMGVTFDWDAFVKCAETYNRETLFEREKWDVAANTNSYPINGVAQALFRIFYSQVGGNSKHWLKSDKKVRKIMDRCVKKNIDAFPKTRHRAIAWSCAPLYYSHWTTWAYNCWGINVIINMDSLMFDKLIRTDTYEHALEDLSYLNEMAPMRAMAVGGHEHIFRLWEFMKQFNCEFVIMYDQLQCKGMQGVHGMFEDEFRERDIHAIWIPHALPEKRTVSRMEIRNIINDYMFTVMQEEPLDPTLIEFDDSESW